MTPSGTTQAFILDTYAWRDNDLMVRLFTREAGSLSVIAYHARKGGRRFPSGLDRLTLAEVTISRKGTGPYVLQGADTRELYWKVKSDLERTCVASLWTEMLMRCHAEPAELGALFDMTGWFLSLLDHDPSPAPQTAALQAAVLIPAALDFLDLEFRCSQCETSGTTGDWLLQTETGQFMCATHGNDRRFGIRLTTAQARLLRTVAQTAGSGPTMETPPGECARLVFKLEPFLTSLFNTRLKSLEFLADMWTAAWELEESSPLPDGHGS